MNIAIATNSVAISIDFVFWFDLTLCCLGLLTLFVCLLILLTSGWWLFDDWFDLGWFSCFDVCVGG